MREIPYEEVRGYSIDKALEPEDGPNRNREFNLEKFIALELCNCERAWQAGRLDALYDAVAFCEIHLCPLPRWVTQGVLAIIAGQYWGTRHGKRGRIANHAAKDRQAEVDWRRWRMVDDMRRREGISLDAVFIRLSSLLQGFPEQGTPRAIKRSYNYVKREILAGGVGKFYRTQNRVI
jgi:hypothetical protein